MPTYRIFCRRADDTIVCRDDFEAPDDETAQAVAELICEACADEHLRHDLWAGTTPLYNRKLVGLTKPFSDLSPETQKITLERLAAIRDSKWLLSGSKRLVQRLDQWQRLLPIAAKSRAVNLVKNSR